jgi:acylphosphatase
MNRIAVRLIVRGRVQGVGFRWWAREEAGRLGLDGWVRNLADGSVELLAAGPETVVVEFIESCRSGPRGARVSSVERHAAADEAVGGFEARPTS